MVKNLRELTSWPNANFAFCPTPSVKAGTKPSPWTSANDVSPPRASISNSPFNEKPGRNHNRKGKEIYVNIKIV